jgi:hypothetical protein
MGPGASSVARCRGSASPAQACVLSTTNRPNRPRISRAQEIRTDELTEGRSAGVILRLAARPLVGRRGRRRSTFRGEGVSGAPRRPGNPSVRGSSFDRFRRETRYGRSEASQGLESCCSRATRARIPGQHPLNGIGLVETRPYRGWGRNLSRTRTRDRGDERRRRAVRSEPGAERARRAGRRARATSPGAERAGRRARGRNQR